MVRLPDAAGQLGNAEDMKNVKELRDIPVRVLRGLFSGVGQLLVAAERLRAETAQREQLTREKHDGPPSGLDGEPAGQPSQASAPAAAAASGQAAGRHRKPADARTAGRPGGRKAKAAGQRQFRSLDATNNVRVLTPDMPAESSSEGDQVPPASGGLPIPGYDGLSLASLRARLRSLDAAQVRALLDYERTTVDRADVVAMFERRIAKLETDAT